MIYSAVLHGWHHEPCWYSGSWCCQHIEIDSTLTDHFGQVINRNLKGQVWILKTLYMVCIAHVTSACIYTWQFMKGTVQSTQS